VPPLKDFGLQSFMYQLIKGVAHCHKHGVMHRDLKPQNLLVDDSKKCLKIADLGLGRAFSIPIKSYTHEVRLEEPIMHSYAVLVLTDTFISSNTKSI
jgi:serine/threonine protein kinase